MGIKGQIPWNKGKIGVQLGYWKNKTRPLETRRKISESLKGKVFRFGYIHSEETREKMSQKLKGRISSRKGVFLSEETKLKISLNRKGKGVGERNGNWIKDRSKLKATQIRNDSAYYNWRKQVWLRDNFKCKIANPDCDGRIEVHHILGWSSHPELRYNLNNGITLCHAHHPRKRAEEKRLSPYFQDLVSVSNG